MSGWQPIETAPKGLEDIILWNGERVFFGWRDDEDNWIDSVSIYEDTEDPQPTHWQPLPAAPEVSE